MNKQMNLRMNKRTLLVSTLVAGLGLANANATLLLRELWDNVSGRAIRGFNQ